MLTRGSRVIAPAGTFFHHPGPRHGGVIRLYQRGAGERCYVRWDDGETSTIDLARLEPEVSAQPDATTAAYLAGIPADQPF